jgi:hypothetical protein
MIKCRSRKKGLVEALFEKEAPGARKAWEDHMDGCPKCASEFDGLTRILGLMDKHDVPDPGPAYWDGYWDRLEKRLDRESPAATAPSGSPLRRGRRPFAPAPRWAWTAASAFALIVVGVLIGRLLPGRPGPAILESVGGRSAAASDASYGELLDGASRYLDRSKVLLIGLVNADAENAAAAPLELAAQKKASGRLVREAAVLKSGLSRSAGPEDRRLARLIGDLEVVLLQIANLEAESDSAAVDVIRAGVRDRGLIFRINLGRIRTDKAAAAVSRSPRSRSAA